MILAFIVFFLILLGGIPALKYFSASFIISFAIGIFACMLLYVGVTIGYWTGGFEGFFLSILVSGGAIIGIMVLIIAFSWMKCSCE